MKISRLARSGSTSPTTAAAATPGRSYRVINNTFINHLGIKLSNREEDINLYPEKDIRLNPETVVPRFTYDEVEALKNDPRLRAEFLAGKLIVTTG